MNVSAGTQFSPSSALELPFEQLNSLSEDQLLTLIGAGSVTAVESLYAVIYAYGSDDGRSAFEAGGLSLPSSVDLVSRGRHTVERIIAEWGEVLRERLCPQLRDRRGERDLAGDIANLLPPLIHPHLWMFVAAISLYIAKYLLAKLCDDWEPSPATARSAT